MKNDKILVQQKDGILTLVLNNPSKLNCMGFAMLNEFDDAIGEAEDSEAVKVVIIKGSGDRAFSTGADLKEFGGLTSAEQADWIEMGNALFNRIEQLGKPTIAFIDGYALGGGLELALACDFRIGTPKAVLSSPELQHGWLPGWGGMTRLRRLFGEPVAKEVVFLCEMIDAEKGLQMGLLHRLVENDRSEEFTKLVQHLASLDTDAFSLAKSSITDASRTTYGEDVQFDVQALHILQKK